MPWGVLRSKQTTKQPPLELTVYEAGDIERSARRRREEIEVRGHLLTKTFVIFVMLNCTFNVYKDYLRITCVYDNV